MALTKRVYQKRWLDGRHLYRSKPSQKCLKVHDAAQLTLAMEGQYLTTCHRGRLQLHLVVVNRQRTCHRGKRLAAKGLWEYPFGQLYMDTIHWLDPVQSMLELQLSVLDTRVNLPLLRAIRSHRANPCLIGSVRQLCTLTIAWMMSNSFLSSLPVRPSHLCSLML